MGTTLNGTPQFAFTPTLPRYNLGGGYSYTYEKLISVNAPIQISVFLNQSGQPPNYTPVNEGDLVNVIFEVFMRQEKHLSGSMFDFQLCTIRKGIDTPQVFQEDTQTTTSPSGAFGYRYYTVDLASILRPYVSYSLAPCGRGTYGTNYLNSARWGGYSGQFGDNIFSPLNGMGRRIAVRCKFEVLDANGELTIATISSGSSTEKTLEFDVSNNTYSNQKAVEFIAVNTVRQWDDNQVVELADYGVDGDSSVGNQKFLCDCPNDATLTSNVAIRKAYKKKVNLDSQTEWLHWFQNSVQANGVNAFGIGDGSASILGQTKSAIFDIYLLVEHEKGGTLYQKKLNTKHDAFWWSVGGMSWTPQVGGYYQLCPPDYENFLVQNVSPYYINNSSGDIPTGESWSDIDDTSDWYRVSIHVEGFENTGGFSGGSCSIAGGGNATYGQLCVANGGTWTPPDAVRVSEYRYYQINQRKESGAFPFVTLYWLNSLGGIDSYCFSRNKTESLTRTFSTYERKNSNPLYNLVEYGAGIDYKFGWDNLHSAGNGGAELSSRMKGDQYEPSVDVLNTTANKTGSIYSDPINNEELKWLEHLLISPNVWMEVSATKEPMSTRVFKANESNPYINPQNNYTPIIVTNSSQELVDSETGMVMFNIQYQHSHKMNTQSN